ncbi:MAG TPA: tetratricopeptide repeat protein [Phycisphaerae bacterium]|nr:tetratricopeptide repeat protein [Phycisphaerae bacterium]HNU45786.1 tetratricopeptide repeat protein [Phycisphaerae bacterium]
MSRRARLEQMLQQQPQDPFLHYALAVELMKEGALDDALASLARVLELDEKYIAAYQLKSQALLKLRRKDEARAALSAGIAAARSVNNHHAADDLQRHLDGLG